MIEDLQDELQKDQPVKTKRTHSRKTVLFFVFILWLIYAAIIILSSLPRILVAVKESDISKTISNLDEIRRSAQTMDAKLCFVIPKADGSTSLVVCNQKITKTGATEYHDVIEALLDGPKEEALSAGAISYIDQGTSLIGLTVSGNTAFVNLSESFTSSGSYWGPSGLDTACKQIARTLQVLDPKIENIIIMVDGEELKL
ncbi:MAG: GerMN domain-containing protein [Spirochaetales bacterium]|nr:GerMN domain-containing protein [Spirochaetales bacterium]